jgi:putative aldouronate transport system substrate-binding protein
VRRATSAIFRVALFLFAIFGINSWASGSADSTKNTEPGKIPDNMNLTGYPIAKKPISLKLATSTQMDVNWNEMPIFQEWEKKLGVDLKWDIYAADGLKQKVSLMLASGDWPDVSVNLGISDDDHLRFGQSGSIMALNGLIKQYSPNWTQAFKDYPEIKKQITMADGNIYSLPMVIFDELQYGIRDSMVINTDWLKAVGMKPPTTTAQFKEVLKSFKTKDPNGNGKQDEIPFTFIYDNYATGYYDLFGSFDIVYGGATIDRNKWSLENGKIIYAAIDPRVRQGLDYLHSLYAEGLIDMEVFTQTSTQRTAKCLSVPRIIGVAAIFNGAGEFGIDSMSRGEYTALVPMAGPSGKKPIVRYQPKYISNNYFTIFRNNKYPEISMRIADFFADQDVGFQGKNGKYDELLDKNKNGLWQLKEKYVSNYASYQALRPENTLPYFLRPETTAMLERVGKDLARKNLFLANKDFIATADQIIQGLIFTAKEQEIRTTIMVDIDKYVSEMHAKFIVEGCSDGAWNGFVKTVEGMKLQSVLDVMQAAQDRYAGHK